MQTEPKRRSDYKYFHPVTTRWSDNDIYGNIDNVVYYSWFNTAVNRFLIANGVLDIEDSPVVGLVVETYCCYFNPVNFPDRISVGLRVTTLGNSSVCYEVGVFRGDEEKAAAQGHYIYVYVDREMRKPTVIPQAMRTVLQSICVNI
jgi:acyl-CoA thioester hydrolase